VISSKLFSKLQMPDAVYVELVKAKTLDLKILKNSLRILAYIPERLKV